MDQTLPVWFGMVVFAAGCVGSSESNARAPTERTVNPPAAIENDAQVPPSAAPQPDRPSSAMAQSSPPRDEFASSRANRVIWKRYAALEADLMRALALNREDVCQELGGRSCTRDIHTIALGGNDPFRSGINRPPSEPSATTPIAVDRLLLSACSTRAHADKTGPVKVFTSLDMGGLALSLDAPGVSTTIRDLYRRLLSRDPKEFETNAVKQLLDPSEPDAPQSAEEFATLACYVIGSSVEFLFD